MERDLSIERTAAIQKHRKYTGRVVTRPPFGTSVDPSSGKLIPNPEEQLIIDYIAKWIHDEPGIRDSEITKRLQIKFDASEIKIRNSKQVYPSMIGKIIERYHLRDQ